MCPSITGAGTRCTAASVTLLQTRITRYAKLRTVSCCGSYYFVWTWLIVADARHSLLADGSNPNGTISVLNRARLFTTNGQEVVVSVAVQRRAFLVAKKPRALSLSS